MTQPSTTSEWTNEPNRLAAPRLWDLPYGDGVYRRSIVLTNDAGHTWGELEDDYHHFRIDLRHDRSVITSALGTGLRGPWTTCLEAPRMIEHIVGMPVGGTSTAIGNFTRARDNCTHLFDLAGLAVSHIARHEPLRRYDMTRTDQDEQGRSTATLHRDHELVLEWQIADGEVVAPDRWKDIPLRRQFIRWAESNLDADDCESAIVLRRGLDIAHGRTMDLDRFVRASEVGEYMHGKCYSFSPERSVEGLRIRGSARDFTDHPDLLLDHLDLEPPASGRFETQP